MVDGRALAETEGWVWGESCAVLPTRLKGCAYAGSLSAPEGQQAGITIGILKVFALASQILRQIGHTILIW